MYYFSLEKYDLGFKLSDIRSDTGGLNIKLFVLHSQVMLATLQKTWQIYEHGHDIKQHTLLEKLFNEFTNPLIVRII